MARSETEPMSFTRRVSFVKRQESSRLASDLVVIEFFARTQPLLGEALAVLCKMEETT